MSEQKNNTDEEKLRRSLLTNPLSAYSIPPWLIYLLGVLGVVYILNPTAGIFELLPDNLPILGNLDEGLAAILIWASLLELVEGRKRRKQGGSSKENL